MKYEVWVERWKCEAFPDGIQRVGFNAKEYEQMIDFISGLRLTDTRFYVFDNGKDARKAKLMDL